ncbi:glycosyltransferase family 8 protein [Saccharata proteae CBS 121410]|uniref:glycogenin glucosyltransferase n=1 Tax=Saccharata proteae CBS 121410 TaxID=1314787 RepID=A0A9P4M030_9PEZI|nr:glycosyltransferase family 8 protein [Saccharata proteae CBS 121410]
MAAHAEDAYCTLVLSDSYLPGAVVLAHSLRDAGTTKKLAALVTLDTLSVDTISELKKLYDVLIPVERIGNPRPANLLLMDRADLAYTFTKLALWRQTQYRKIVYIDADVVALRAPDELFDIEASFAAAPDVGWPDAFNTGVMVISPDMGEYWALRTLASSGDSFDGADQGLLNQYYEHRGWHRISFTYNCTPNAQYQWEPAYKHYKSRINMVHFIGKSKPWMDSPQGGGPGVYNELLAKWWAVYDKHLRTVIEGEAAGRDVGMSGTEHTPVSETVESLPMADEPLSDCPDRAESIGCGLTHPGPMPEERPFSPPRMEWDATKSAPPVESRPEAANFPTQTYGFSEDRGLFKAPAKYPEPPKDMWYKVPESRPKVWEPPKPIFPWEQEHVRPAPTRVFAEDLPMSPPEPMGILPPVRTAEEEAMLPQEVPSEEGPSEGNPWQAFGQTAGNAWDSVPGIDRYVRAVIDAQTKRTKPSGLSLSDIGQLGDLSSPTGPTPTKGRRESLKLTDFPSAFERPSLPVTPAPVRRPTFWGDERDETGQLPAAEGVPDQADWNPEERLEQLRRSSLLEFEHLKSATAAAANTPQRNMPEHSVPTEAAKEKQDVQQQPVLSGGATQHGMTPTAAESNTTAAESSASQTQNATPIVTAPGGLTFREPAFSSQPGTTTVSKSEAQQEEVLSPTEK